MKVDLSKVVFKVGAPPDQTYPPKTRSVVVVDLSRVSFKIGTPPEEE